MAGTVEHQVTATFTTLAEYEEALARLAAWSLVPGNPPLVVKAKSLTKRQVVYTVAYPLVS